MKNLKNMLKSKKPLVIPGVYDALGAKIAQKVGFDAMFQTGYGTSATLFGMPDYGFIGSAETVDNARRICRAVTVPVIVDSDTGYGYLVSIGKRSGVDRRVLRQVTFELGPALHQGSEQRKELPRRCLQ